MKHHVLISLALFVFGVASLHAQDEVRGPDGTTSTHVSGVEVLASPQMPFSGKSNIEWTRMLEDGSQVVVHLQANVARDSQGRVYRERRSFAPANSNQPNRLNEIHIYDPVARTQTICNVTSFRCVRKGYAPVTFFNVRATGWFDNNTRFLAREDLGSDVINGQSVVGTRETITVNPGRLGNNRPLVSTREFWYLPELKTNIAVTRDDPREGKQVIRLTDLSFSEPNPELFKVPIGYAVVDERPPGRGAVFGSAKRPVSAGH